MKQTRLAVRPWIFSLRLNNRHGSFSPCADYKLVMQRGGVTKRVRLKVIGLGQILGNEDTALSHASAVTASQARLLAALQSKREELGRHHHRRWDHRTLTLDRAAQAKCPRRQRGTPRAGAGSISCRRGYAGRLPLGNADCASTPRHRERAHVSRV